MGMTFDVDVNVKTHGKEDIDTLEKQIEKLKSNPVDIKIDLTGNGVDFNKIFNDIQKRAQYAGKNIGESLQKGIQQGIKSNKFDSDSFLENYIEQENKNLKESENVAKKYKTTQQTALKAVRARNSAEIKANNENITQQKQLQKELDAMEKFRIQSIENARKREEKLTLQQNKAINKSLENNYKQQKKESEKQAKQQKKESEKQTKQIQNISDNFWKQEFESQFNDRHTKSPILQQMSNYYKELEVESEKQAKQISKIRDNLFNGTYDSKSATLSSKLSPYSNQNDNNLINYAREQAKLYDNTLSNLKRHFDSNDSFKLDDDKIVSSFETMNDSAKKFDNTMVRIRSTQSKDLGLGVAERSANSVKNYYEKNTRALKKYGIELKDLENQYRNIKTQDEKANLDNQFKNLQSKISAEGLTGKSLFHELGRGFKQIGQFAVTYGVIQKIPEVISRSVSELKDVDDILTEISKTSDLTSSQIKELGESSFDSASKYGKKASDYLTGIQEMSRSGFYGEQAEQLAELSLLGQAAGDMSRDVSDSYLLATNAAYEYKGSVEKLNSVLDGQNMINKMVMLYRNI